MRCFGRRIFFRQSCILTGAAILVLGYPSSEPSAPKSLLIRDLRTLLIVSRKLLENLSQLAFGFNGWLRFKECRGRASGPEAPRPLLVASTHPAEPP